MKKTVKSKKRTKTPKARENVYAELGMSLSEMYLKCERDKTNQFIEEYSSKLEEQQEYVQECYETIDKIGHGKSQEELRSSMSQFPRASNNPIAWHSLNLHSRPLDHERRRANFYVSPTPRSVFR